jgi:hypothetical protein
MERGADMIGVLDVPGPTHNEGRARSELRSACRLGDWDFQMLGLAAHVGGAGVKSSGAASTGAGRVARRNRRREMSSRAPARWFTPPMQALRASIHQVAATDFTV